MIVLVLNSGSSSLRFQIIETDLDAIARDADRRLARGRIERIGSLALISIQVDGRPRIADEQALVDHRAAIDHVLRWIVSSGSGIDGVRQLSDLHAVGHRVVHGGERFRASVRIDDEVVEGIEDHVELAPLHNPANLKGIRAVLDLLGEAMPQVAVFDTAFHASMPEVAFLYGLPYHMYRRHKIRRYGFHGTSHRYLAYRYRKMLGLEKEAVNVITLHLGNGSSACAIQGGRSVDTSMGFTPLEGLIMGTRSGDIDPSLVDFLAHKEGLSLSEIDTLLNKQSGLLGISGLTDDMRELLLEVEENQDRRARLAIEMYCRRVRKYVGAYFAEMGGEVDALVFAGGIGENSPEIRERIAGGLTALGLSLDRQRNLDLEPGERDEISEEGSRLRCFVIPTDEELMIARDTVRVLEGDLQPELDSGHREEGQQTELARGPNETS